MSRLLVALAAALFVLLGIVPIALMLARAGSDDLALICGARTWTLLGRTLLVGCGAASVALLVGLPFGFLTARARLPGAEFFGSVGILPLLMPPLVMAMTITVATGLRGAVAIVLVLGLATYPLVALYTARALRRIDGRLIDAARLAGGLGAALRIQLPLVLRSALAAACFAFTLAINDFAVPDYVSSIGTKFPVYADEIFASWRSDKDSGRAVALSLPIVFLTWLALVPAVRWTRRDARSLGGDFRAGERLELGRLRWPALLFLLGVLAGSVGLPLGRLAWESGGGPRGFALATMSAAFARALELARGNVRASLTYATAAALLVAPIALVLGHALARARGAARAAYFAVLLPISVPAILFGIGGIALWNRELCTGVYDTGWMAILLFVGRFAPLAVLALAAGAATLDSQLEDSARLAGAGPLKRLLWIVAPALAPAWLGGMMLVFVLSLRELDAAILVPAANDTVLFRLYNAVHFGRDDFVAALALLIVFFVVLPLALHATLGRRRAEFLP